MARGRGEEFAGKRCGGGDGIRDESIEKLNYQEKKNGHYEQNRKETLLSSNEDGSHV